MLHFSRLWFAPTPIISSLGYIPGHKKAGDNPGIIDPSLFVTITL